MVQKINEYKNFSGTPGRAPRTLENHWHTGCLTEKLWLETAVFCLVFNFFQAAHTVKYIPTAIWFPGGVDKCYFSEEVRSEQNVQPHIRMCFLTSKTLMQSVITVFPCRERSPISCSCCLDRCCCCGTLWIRRRGETPQHHVPPSHPDQPSSSQPPHPRLHHPKTSLTPVHLRFLSTLESAETITAAACRCLTAEYMVVI